MWVIIVFSVEMAKKQISQIYEEINWNFVDKIKWNLLGKKAQSSAVIKHLGTHTQAVSFCMSQLSWAKSLGKLWWNRMWVLKNGLDREICSKVTEAGCDTDRSAISLSPRPSLPLKAHKETCHSYKLFVHWGSGISLKRRPGIHVVPVIHTRLLLQAQIEIYCLQRACCPFLRTFFSLFYYAYC